MITKIYRRSKIHAACSAALKDIFSAIYSKIMINILLAGK